jgi:hypothetical protein
MFQLQWTPAAAATYAQLRAKAWTALQTRAKSKPTKAARDEGLFQQVHKCVTHLQANPRHPGLNTHEFHSLENPYDPSGKVFEAYVQNRTPGAYRLFWCYGPDQGQITILAITPHP